MAVTELTPDDADWAADLMVARRREYENYSPVFWRPAAHARARHVRFLRRQIADPATVALRSPRGFLIAQLRPAEAFVDDFVIEPDGTWAFKGYRLTAFTNEEEAAVAAANDPEYGLVSYVYTKDLKRAFRVAERLVLGQRLEDGVL